MKRPLIFSALIAMMFALSGCPIKTDNSIDNGSMDVPSWLTGTWKKDSSSSSLSYYLQKTGAKGNFTAYDVEPTGEHTNGRKCIISDVGGTPFLSVFYPKDDESEDGYYLYKLKKVSNKVMVLVEVKDGVTSSSLSQEALKEFLTKNKDFQSTYSDSSTYTKK